jgi:hypothetical protein
MMNQLKSRTKKSKVDSATNKYIIIIVICQFLLCFFAGAYTNVWMHYWGDQNFPYLEFGVGVSASYPPAKSVFISVVAWFLLLMNFVSISLLVTLEMVKFF